MKTLKFSKNLIADILAGKKTITWRCFDNKDLKEGDEVLFLEHETKEPFAKAVLIEVREKTFAELNEEDKKGHEKFRNDEEMYKTYSEYYGKEIIPDTLVKIIKFKILTEI
jgi:hypothetical protein